MKSKKEIEKEIRQTEIKLETLKGELKKFDIEEEDLVLVSAKDSAYDFIVRVSGVNFNDEYAGVWGVGFDISDGKIIQNCEFTFKNNWIKKINI